MIGRFLIEFFKRSLFFILFPNKSSLSKTSLKTSYFYTCFIEYQDAGGRNITQYIQSIMGQAVQLKGQEYINLRGIPAGFWSGDEWSVMSLAKFHDDGLLGSSKSVALLGDGITDSKKGFHLGMQNKV